MQKKFEFLCFTMQKKIEFLCFTVGIILDLKFYAKKNSIYKICLLRKKNLKKILEKKLRQAIGLILKKNLG